MRLLWLVLIAGVGAPAGAEELSGRIVNHLGQGLDQVKIRVFQIETGEPTSGIPYRTLPDGRFGPIRLEPGRYRLVATHLRNRSTMRYMTQVIDVEAPDANAIVVMRPIRRYRIEGIILDAPERSVVQAEALEVEPDGGPGRLAAKRLRTGKGLVFTDGTAQGPLPVGPGRLRPRRISGPGLGRDRGYRRSDRFGSGAPLKAASRAADPAIGASEPPRRFPFPQRPGSTQCARRPRSRIRAD